MTRKVTLVCDTCPATTTDMPARGWIGIQQPSPPDHAVAMVMTDHCPRCAAAIAAALERRAIEGART
jgi:hypothetical protein